MTKRSTGRLAAVAMERRDVAADAGVEGRHFVGHAAVFNQRTAIGDPTRWGFYEVVAPTAFDKTLREADVVMLSDHDPSKPLARTSAGTREGAHHKSYLQFLRSTPVATARPYDL